MLGVPGAAPVRKIGRTHGLAALAVAAQVPVVLAPAVGGVRGRALLGRIPGELPAGMQEVALLAIFEERVQHEPAVGAAWFGGEEAPGLIES